MHGLINVKSLNNISKWQVGFNSAFKGLIYTEEARVFRTAEMQILKQIGTMIYVECPVVNLFPATEKDFCVSQTAPGVQETKPEGGGGVY
jgi:hypothetical protein